MKYLFGKGFWPTSASVLFLVNFRIMVLLRLFKCFESSLEGKFSSNNNILRVYLFSGGSGVLTDLSLVCSY